MFGKRNDDELNQLHRDRALSEMDVGITDYGENDVILEENLGTGEKSDASNHK